MGRVAEATMREESGVVVWWAPRNAHDAITLWRLIGAWVGFCSGTLVGGTGDAAPVAQRMDESPTAAAARCPGPSETPRPAAARPLPSQPNTSASLRSRCRGLRAGQVETSIAFSQPVPVKVFPTNGPQCLLGWLSNLHDRGQPNLAFAN